MSEDKVTTLVERVKTDNSLATWKREASGFVRAYNSHESAAGDLMVRGALVVYGAIKSGYIGKTSEGAAVTQGEYAAQIGVTRIGGTDEHPVMSKGKSSGYVTLLRRLGVALIEHGVDRPSVEWNLLANKTGANHRVVGAFLDGAPQYKDTDGLMKAVPSTLDECLRLAFKTDDKGNLTSERIKATDAAGDPVSNPDEPTPDAIGDAANVTPSKVADAFETLLAYTSAHLGDLSEDTLKRLADVAANLDTIVAEGFSKGKK